MKSLETCCFVKDDVLVLFMQAALAFLENLLDTLFAVNVLQASLTHTDPQYLHVSRNGCPFDVMLEHTGLVISA